MYRNDICSMIIQWFYLILSEIFICMLYSIVYQSRDKSKKNSIGSSGPNSRKSVSFVSEDAGARMEKDRL
jgi:hypothetical protein